MNPVFFRMLAVAIIAVTVAAVPLSAQAAGPENGGKTGGAWLVSAGPDFGAGPTRAWQSGFTTIEYRGAAPVITLWGTALMPVWSASVGRSGAVLATAGVHARFQLGLVELTPHFGVGLYQSGQGGAGRGKELVQFRSGIDAFLPLTDRTALGVGVFHVSNAGITRRSANLDVVRFVVRQKF